ncbi:hypothetical protein [Tenacibaculum sp. 190524A05c]|uniref:hypothetical protein n=1 Tax=Tenacibaculum platacis TaxID=3137852 RepID=UPI0031FB672D
MALNANSLASDIANALKNNVSVGGSVPNSNGDAESIIDNSVQKMAEAIAKAVVDHIKQNLEVKSLGTGYNGFQVNSNSTNIS